MMKYLVATFLISTMIFVSGCVSNDPLIKARVGMPYEEFVRLLGKPSEEEMINIGSKGAPPNPRGANTELHMPPNTAYKMATFRREDGSTILVSVVSADDDPVCPNVQNPPLR